MLIGVVFDVAIKYVWVGLVNLLLFSDFIIFCINKSMHFLYIHHDWKLFEINLMFSTSNYIKYISSTKNNSVGIQWFQFIKKKIQGWLNRNLINKPTYYIVLLLFHQSSWRVGFLYVEAWRLWYMLLIPYACKIVQ